MSILVMVVVAMALMVGGLFSPSILYQSLGELWSLSVGLIMFFMGGAIVLGIGWSYKG